MPGWLAPLAQFTSTVGVPTVFAMILLWFVLTRLDTTLKVVEDQEEARTLVVEKMGKDFIAAIASQGDRFESAIQDNIAANKELQENATRERREIIEKLMEGKR
jgi:hypothetical protein